MSFAKAKRAQEVGFLPQEVMNQARQKTLATSFERKLHLSKML